MSTFNELIDFTRSTTGTYLDSVVYGPELVTNGDFSNGTAGWTPYNATLSASNNTLSIIDNGGWSSAWQAISTVVGKTYTFSATLKRYGGVYAAHLEASSTLNQESSSWEFQKSTTDVEATLTIVFKATATTTYIRMRNDGLGNTVDWNNITVKEVTGGQVSGTPLLRTAAINEPRLEYDASGNPLGLLIEEARTNLVPYSEAFTQGNWDKVNTTITSNSAVSPDGQSNASLVTVNSASYGFVREFLTISAAANTFSVFAKAGTTSSIQLWFVQQGVTDGVASIDLSTGAVTGISVGWTGGVTTKYVGNGWYRIQGTRTFTASANNHGVGVAAIGQNGLNFYIYGAQLEEGAFPTSYIPTSGSAVTRAKDVSDVPVERFGYNTGKGSIVVYAQSNKPAVSVYAFELSASSGDRMFSKFQNEEHLRVRVSFADTAVIDAGDIETGSFAKLGARFANNDFAVSIDGNTPVTDTNGAVNLNASELKIGQSLSNSEQLNGHIKQIQYFPKRLSNEELQLLTQPSASPTMNLTFDGQATSTLVEGLHD